MYPDRCAIVQFEILFSLPEENFSGMTMTNVILAGCKAWIDNLYGFIAEPLNVDNEVFDRIMLTNSTLREYLDEEDSEKTLIVHGRQYYALYKSSIIQGKEDYKRFGCPTVNTMRNVDKYVTFVDLSGAGANGVLITSKDFENMIASKATVFFTSPSMFE